MSDSKNIFIRFLICLMAVIIALPLQMGNVMAQGTVQDEQTLKALFIYNFTKQIEWSPQKMTGTKFTIAVLGKSEVAKRLAELLHDRKIFDKQIEVVITDKPEETTNAQIIFIPRVNNDKLAVLLDKISGKSSLVITEEKKMPLKGASINLYTKDDRLRFELSEGNMKKESLKVSNQLIALASAGK